MHHQAPPTLGEQRRCPCAVCQLCDVKENLCREFAAYFWFHLGRGEAGEEKEAVEVVLPRQLTDATSIFKCVTKNKGRKQIEARHVISMRYNTIQYDVIRYDKRRRRRVWVTQSRSLLSRSKLIKPSDCPSCRFNRSPEST